MGVFDTIGKGIAGYAGNGLRGVAGVSNYLSYQRDYNWDIVMPFSKGSIFGELLSEHVQSVSFGEYNFSEIVKKRYGGHQVHYPGLMDIGEVTFMFLKPTPDIVSLFFRSWRDEIVSKNGLYNPKNVYKENMYVLLTSNNTIFPFTERFRLTGCFPKTLPSYSLAYSSEKMVELSVTLSVDKIEPYSLMKQFSETEFGKSFW